MRLELESGQVVEEATEQDIRSLVEGEDFAILSSDPNTYIWESVDLPERLSGRRWYDGSLGHAMSRWTFEPGHTAAEFSVRHMMVTHVRGHFKNVHGTLEFDPASPTPSRVEAVIDARGLWSGEADRDAHLKSADFLDVERFPEITFRGDRVRLRGADEAAVLGDLTVRGVTRPVELRGGVVVGDDVAVTIDGEAILQS